MPTQISTGRDPDGDRYYEGEGALLTVVDTDTPRPKVLCDVDLELDADQLRTLIEAASHALAHVGGYRLNQPDFIESEAHAVARAYGREHIQRFLDYLIPGDIQHAVWVRAAEIAGGA